MTRLQTEALPPGFRLFPHGELDSTNSEALRRLGKGGRHGDVVQASVQTAGRGRRGRHWVSGQGNLHASVILIPQAARAPGQLAFVAALGLGDALDECAPKGCAIRFKWPNDVLIGGLKAAGILIEAGQGPGAVIGIGVNIATAPEAPSIAATSLTSQGFGPVTPGELLSRLCHRLDGWYRRWQGEGFEPVRAAWLARAAGLGDTIEARLARGAEQGVFGGIDADGALILEGPDGGRRIIAAGEVYFGNPSSRID